MAFLKNIRKALVAVSTVGSPSIERRYVSASVALRSGNLQPMRAVADSSLGDAWLALANVYGDSQMPQGQAAATVALRKALDCKFWLKDQSSACQSQYDRRRFLGIGIEPNYRRLAHEWESHYFPGYLKEFELAWIYARGPGDLRHEEVAWKWLAIGEARWGGNREVELPGTSLAQMRAALTASVSQRYRLRAIEEAKSLAYQEFVEGK